MIVEAPAAPQATKPPLLDRVIATEHQYFELGARVERLPGAILAWTPAFVQAPGAAVVHRVDMAAVADCDPGWPALVAARLAELGVGLARIYLTDRDARVEALLAHAGFACREELMFTGKLADPPPLLTFHPVRSAADWAEKRRFHQAVPQSPDGHGNRAADLVGLERHKVAHGMAAFLARLDGRTIGVVGALWGDGVARVKNLLVHPDFRRRSVATGMLSHIAALGRARGIGEQCLMAIKGGTGELLYRSLGMRVIGRQFEWSQRLGNQ